MLYHSRTIRSKEQSPRVNGLNWFVPLSVQWVCRLRVEQRDSAPVLQACDRGVTMRRVRVSDSSMNDSQTNETWPCCGPVSENFLTNEEVTQTVNASFTEAARHASFAVTKWEWLITLLMVAGALPPFIWIYEPYFCCTLQRMTSQFYETTIHWVIL